MQKTRSPILAAVHDTAKGLHKAGVMDQVTLHEFDQLCVPPVEPLEPEQIKRIRESTRRSQAVLARLLNTSSGMEMYAEDGGPEDYVEPSSGKAIRVARDIAGNAIPADSLYTRVFEQQVAGGSLIGLSCYLPDWQIPGHRAEQERREKLDELFGDLDTL